MPAPSPADADRRPLWRSPLGCLCGLIMLPAVGLVFVLLLAWAFAGGIADAGDLRPLPTDVEVVHESTDVDACPGNGNGWFLCHRTVRLRDDRDRGDDLFARVVEHYRAEGHQLEPLRGAELDVADGPAPPRAAGRPGCLADGVRGRVRCLVVADRVVGVDVSMLSWVYTR